MLSARTYKQLARQKDVPTSRSCVSFFRFIQRHNPTLLGFEHVPRLVQAAQQVIDGEVNRLLVMLPPRYFKSEIFSRLLPAYILSHPRHTTKHVGLASYSADLAWKLSSKARERFVNAGGELAPSSHAKKLWQTAVGGEMWAAGIDGSITGSGFHFGIIDDPMKPVHARSRTYVEAFRAFYADTWYNRQEPGAAMIVVMQRLGQEDPIDYLLRREVGDKVDPAPEHWHVLCCDEIKSMEPLARYDGPMGLPPTCTLIDDPRGEGDLLAPSRFDSAQVQKQQAAAGVFCGAQRQQRPSQPTGDVWQESWFGLYGSEHGDPYEDIPESTIGRGYDWDTAYTKDEHNSASAFVESQRSAAQHAGKHRIYISGCDWRWLETPELVAWMKQKRGPHHIEAKASGKSAKQFLDREGVSAQEVQVTAGDKFARTNGATPNIARPHGAEDWEPVVYVHASIYQKLLFGERQGLLHVTQKALLKGVPDLDLNDALTQAIYRHAKTDIGFFVYVEDEE